MRKLKTAVIIIMFFSSACGLYAAPDTVQDCENAQTRLELNLKPFLWRKRTFQKTGDYTIEGINPINHKTLFTLRSMDNILFKDAVTLPSGETAFLEINEENPESNRWSLCIYDEQGSPSRRINIAEAAGWELTRLGVINGELYLFGGASAQNFPERKDVYPLVIRLDVTDGENYEILELPGIHEKNPNTHAQSGLEEKPDGNTAPLRREWVRDMTWHDNRYYLLSEIVIEHNKTQRDKIIMLRVCDNTFTVILSHMYDIQDRDLALINILSANNKRVLFYCMPQTPSAPQLVMNFDLKTGMITETELEVKSNQEEAYSSGVYAYNDGTLVLGRGNALYFYRENESGVGGNAFTVLYPRAPDIGYGNQWSISPDSFIIERIQSVSSDVYMLSGNLSRYTHNTAVPLLNWICAITKDGTVLWQNHEMYGAWEMRFSFSRYSADELMNNFRIQLSEEPYHPGEYEHWREGGPFDQEGYPGDEE